MTEAKARYEARLTRRHADLVDLVGSLGVEELRALVVRMAIRSPSLVFDIMDATEVADNGDPDNERHHPPEDVSAWCRCGNCRHMPSAAEQLCCKMHPRHCLSQRAELEMLVLDEGVLAVADQHRADMLAGEVRLNNEGCVSTICVVAARARQPAGNTQLLRLGNPRPLPVGGPPQSWLCAITLLVASGAEARHVFCLEFRNRPRLSLHDGTAETPWISRTHRTGSCHWQLVGQTHPDDLSLQRGDVAVCLRHLSRHCSPLLGTFVEDSAVSVIIANSNLLQSMQT